MLKKTIKLTGAMLAFAIAALFFKPVRVWASQEGSYLYHQFFLSGPAVFYSASTSYTGSDGTARTGVAITTGTPAAMSGVASIRFLGAQGAKPATSTEGDWYYDTVQHTVAMATCTSSGNDCWLKANRATTGAAWTLY